MKICFVVLHAYSLFYKNKKHAFGGMEVRSYLFATGLAQKTDIDVSYVVIDKGQRSRIIEGVRVYPHRGYVDYDPLSQINQRVQAFDAALSLNTKNLYTRVPFFPYIHLKQRSLRAFMQVVFKFVEHIFFALPLQVLSTYLLRPLWTKHYIEAQNLPTLRIEDFDYQVPPLRYHIYDKCDADIYVTFGVNHIGAELAKYCKWKNKRYALFIADDTDVQAAYTPTSSGTNDYDMRNDLCYYSIVNADIIFAQTNFQQQMLFERFGKQGVLLMNPIDLTTHLDPHVPVTERQIALWVGRSDRIKKMPERLLALAKETPDIDYVMVMNPWDMAVFDDIVGNLPANVTVIERVPYHEIEALFAKAFVFVNTSDKEGFPNTFLQAGKYGVPLLSYKFDPDGIFEAHECGVFAHESFDAFVAGMRTIRDNDQLAQVYSRNIRTYIENQHDLEQQVIRLKVALERFYNRLYRQ